MKFLTLTAATFALAAAAPAHAQFFGPGVDNNTVLGGLAGAGIGGAIGSNIAGSGNRDEGTAIGALVGGLAGAAYGNSRSNYYANPYAGSFNPGFSGQSFVGTAIGAGIGGAIGSNLAADGVREEGTALGALLGGVAGYALSDNRGAFGTRANVGYGFNAPAYSGGAYGSGYGYGYSSGGYTQGYGGSYYGGSSVSYPVVSHGRYYGGVSHAPGGYVYGGAYPSSSTHYVTTPGYTSVQPVALPVVSSTTHTYYSHSGVVGGLAHGEKVVGYSSGCYNPCATRCHTGC